MDDLIATYEAALRLGVFLGVFMLMAAWELLAPRRRLPQSKSARWLNNIGLVVLNTVVLRIVFPMSAVGVAAYVAQQQWGLFNQISEPGWLVVIATVGILDGIIYLQHVMFHVVPAFWRLHRVHHSHHAHEANSNFGFNLSLWDRVFGTCRDQPDDGHTDMVIGIDTFHEPRQCINLPGLLLMPFIGKITDYAINSRRWSKPDES